MKLTLSKAIELGLLLSAIVAGWVRMEMRVSAVEAQLMNCASAEVQEVHGSWIQSIMSYILEDED